MPTLTDQIIALLDQHNIHYVIKEHAPTPTSEDSARARGEPKKIGAKALLFKADDKFILCILPADRNVDSKAIKTIYNAKNLRLATIDELKEQTGCDKGAVPPFGSLMQIEMIVDQALFDEEFMAFNAGSLTTSIKMKTEDYKKIVPLMIKSFSLKKDEHT